MIRGLTLTEAVRHMFAGNKLIALSKKTGIYYHSLGSIKSRALAGNFSADRSRELLLKAGYTEMTEFIFKAPKRRRIPNGKK